MDRSLVRIFIFSTLLISRPALPHGNCKTHIDISDASPTQTDWVGKTITRNFELKNVGHRPAKHLNLTLSSGLQFVGGTCTNVLKGGQTCYVDVAYTVNSISPQNYVLTVTYGKKRAPHFLKYTFTVTGVRGQAGSTDDQTFGSGGKVVFDFSGADDMANAMAVQADKKILLSGRVGVERKTFGIARFLESGEPDLSFGLNATVTLPIGTGNSAVRAMAVASNGTIVVGGYAIETGGDNFAVARVLPNGAVDPSFGENGFVIIPIQSANDWINALVIQPDGKILAGGYSSNGFKDSAVLVRLNVDGSLDNTFGIGGMKLIDIGSGNDWINAMVLQPDGKMIASGKTIYEGQNQAFVMRLLANGDLDPSFGTNGITIGPVLPYSGFIRSLALQPDGKIVGSGIAKNALDDDFVVYRFNSNGSIDTAFGGTGVVVTDVSWGSFDSAYGVVVQSNGSIVAAGYGFFNNRWEFALLRLKTDGSADTSFGPQGVISTSLGNSTDSIRAVALSGNDKIIGAGYVWNGVDYDFGIARYWQ